MSQSFPITADPRFRISTATAGQTAFSVPFPFQRDEDIAVVRINLDGTAQTLTRPADYTISGKMEAAGGTVTLTAGATAGQKIIRVGTASLARLVSIVRDGKFSSKAIDDDIDRFVIIAQELARDSDRAVKAPLGTVGPVIHPGGVDKLLVFDDDGNILAAEATAAEVLEATGVAVNAAQGAVSAQGIAEEAASQSSTSATVAVAAAEAAEHALSQFEDLADSKLDKAGDTMTGPLVLDADPSAPLEAATKGYVDGGFDGLGTAASRDVQTDRLDTTAGRLMPVGAFGLGGFAGPVLTEAGALDNISVTRWDMISGSAQATVGGISGFGSCIVETICHNASWRSQKMIELQSPYRVARRSRTFTNIYTDWRIDTPAGDFEPGIPDDLPFPAIIEQRRRLRLSEGPYTIPYSADGDDAVQSAIAEAEEGMTLVLERNDNWQFDESIVLDNKSLYLDATGSELTWNSNVRMLEADFPYTEMKTLTANYTKGSLEIPVNAMDIPLRPGEVFKIISNARDPANRGYAAAESLQYRCGEYAIAAPGTTATSIKLYSPLRFVRGISPSTNDTEIDAYTTAMGARIVRLNPKSYGVKGGVWKYPIGQSWDSGLGIYFRGGLRPVVRDLSMPQLYNHGISVRGTVEALADRVQMAMLRPDADNGYGFLDQGFASVLRDSRGDGFRHYVSVGGARNELNDWSAWHSVGRIMHGRIVRCMGSGGHYATFDTHHAAEDYHFIDCTAIGGEGPSSRGFALRGRGIKIINPKVRNTRAGILAFTEWTDGGLLNSKAPWALTSVDVVNPDIECQVLPFECRNAFLQVGGNHRVRYGSLKAYEVSGQIDISGQGDYVVTDFQGARPIISSGGSLLDLQDTNTTVAAGGMGPARMRLGAGCDLRFKASEAISGQNAWSIYPDGAKVINRGQIRMELPNSVVRFFQAEGGVVFEGRPGSNVQFSVAGKADDAITLNTSGRPGFYHSDDGTVNIANGVYGAD